ncbi:MAG: hypothetical protein DRI61_16155, partial [Chloroflexi bacterium]
MSPHELVREVLQLMSRWDELPVREVRPLSAALVSFLEGDTDEALKYAKISQSRPGLESLGAFTEAHCYLMKGDPLKALEISIGQSPDIGERIASHTLKVLEEWTLESPGQIHQVISLLPYLEKKEGVWKLCWGMLTQKIIEVDFLLGRIEKSSDYFGIGRGLFQLPPEQVIQSAIRGFHLGIDKGWISEVSDLLREALENDQLNTQSEFLLEVVNVIHRLAAYEDVRERVEELIEELIIIISDRLAEPFRSDVLTKIAEVAIDTGFEGKAIDAVDFIGDPRERSRLLARLLISRDDPSLRFRYVQALLDADRSWDAYISWLYLEDRVSRGRLVPDFNLFDRNVFPRLFNIVLRPPMPKDYRAYRKKLNELFNLGDGGPEWNLLYGYLLYLEFASRHVEPLRRLAKVRLGLSKYQDDVGLASLLLGDLEGDVLIPCRWKEYISKLCELEALKGQESSLLRVQQGQLQSIKRSI